MGDEIEHLDIGSGVLLENVDKFCCLMDMLNANRGCNSVVTEESDVQGKISTVFTYF